METVSIFGEMDPLGLESVMAGDIATVQAAIEAFSLLGWTAAVRRAERSQNGEGNETAPNAEITALFSANAFTTVINSNYFENILKSNGGSSFVYNGTYGGINYGIVNGVPLNDLAASYGHLGGSATGNFQATKNGSVTNWSISTTFTFTDRYDFGGPDPFSSAFRRLQNFGVYSIYNTSGTFTRTYSGSFE